MSLDTMAPTLVWTESFNVKLKLLSGTFKKDVTINGGDGKSENDGLHFDVKKYFVSNGKYQL